MRQDVEFVSEGVLLRGWLLLPEGAGPHPGVVVTGGFGGVKEVFLAHDYPQVFCDAGLAVLVYDHINCGASDGLPRRELDPIKQQRGYKDAITFLAAHPDVDAERIGIWGTSYSGGHVLAVGAADRRVRCVVSQAMTISGRDNTIARNTPAQVVDLYRRLGRGPPGAGPGRAAGRGPGLRRRQRHGGLHDQAARGAPGATGATRSRCAPGSTTPSTSRPPSSSASARGRCS